MFASGVPRGGGGGSRSEDGCKVSTQKPLRFVVIMMAAIVAGHAAAARPAAFDRCRIYGFAPHSRDYIACRMNKRRFWTTGRCDDWRFARHIANIVT